MPRLFTPLLSQDALAWTGGAALQSLRGQLARVTAAGLGIDFPYFQWRVLMGVYLAPVAKELSIHRWDIEAAIDPAALLDALAVAMIPSPLWATPLSSRPQRGLSSTICAAVDDGRFAWRLHRGRLCAVVAEVTAAPDALSTGSTECFALVALDCLHVRHAQLTGDEELTRAFLAACSYRAGPMPFFDP